MSVIHYLACYIPMFPNSPSTQPVRAGGCAMQCGWKGMHGTGQQLVSVRIGVPVSLFKLIGQVEKQTAGIEAKLDRIAASVSKLTDQIDLVNPRHLWR
jgi:hypothetical protein